MRSLFPGWTLPDETALSRYWAEATFAVDTSVLLDLYRFSEETRAELLNALRSLGDRLWVPHRVADEFHRNRFGVLLAQREAEDKLLGELAQMREGLDEQLSKALRGAGRRDVAPLQEAIAGAFDSLKERLQETEKAHTKGLGDSIGQDPIYDEVASLCEGRIGPAFTEKRYAEVISEAEERFEKEVPPGYLDSDKDGDAKFGDVILWYQLCDRANETRRPMVLIADDQKDDWIWKVRGKALGPRPELVSEMDEKAGVGFHIYTPARFLEVWEDRDDGRDVKREILDEIQDLAVEPSGTEGVRRPSRIMQSRAEPEHRRFGDSIELAIIPDPESRAFGSGAVGVSVTDPRGATATKMVLGVRDENVPAHGRLAVRYPDDFPEAGKLRSGRYFVVWHETGLPLADFVEALEIAHETFVLRLRALGGHIHYAIERP